MPVRFGVRRRVLTELEPGTFQAVLLIRCVSGVIVGLLGVEEVLGNPAAGHELSRGVVMVLLPSGRGVFLNYELKKLDVLVLDLRLCWMLRGWLVRQL